MANISPGVFTKIIDLSTFVAAVPATIGLCFGLAPKGRDNQLVFVGSRADFISEWGEPDINLYGRAFGQGPYISYNHLGESGSFYWMRVMPDDAAYSNLRIDSQLAASDASASVSISYVDSINSLAEMRTNLQTSGDTQPVGFLYPIGRGDYYNGISVRITEFSNPLLFDTYVLDIYEKQSDGDEVIIESFNVSFDPNARDDGGDSIFIASVLETFSSILRFQVFLDADEEVYTDGFNLVARNYDKEIGNVSVGVDATAAIGWIRDNKQDFSEWETSPETGNANYALIAKDGRGNTIWGWLGAAYGSEEDSIYVYKDRNLTGATRGWNGAISSFDANSEITYRVKQSVVSIASAFTSSTPVPLKKGSDGSLVDTAGDLDTDEAETLLQQAYSGLLTDPTTSTLADQILDPEAVYFTLVYDAGYPTDVKTAISTLVQTRRDCVAIIDNGDNTTVNAALSRRENVHTYNNFYTALYESYNKVSDPFTGADIWFSPIYHLSYIIPRSDNVAEIWFAPAGFNRAAIDSIKELRFNPRLGQRDQLYLKQLNPIVKFAQGYTVWGQLTSQAKPSALQDLNVVRMVLFVKRALEQFCRFFVFEQNDAITWGQVSGSIVEFLEVIKQRRGLDAYTVDVGATDYEKKTKTFHVDVFLTPTRAAEKIELNFFIQG